ncbi:hypothetical protein SDC9_172674 [bioreactor metagenome]|uniref:Uncharacterized protein n=1 Tax=bioreactor metagenome TaxID=1076179 RepID=A0A645GEC3_9ZZZZ
MAVGALTRPSTDEMLTIEPTPAFFMEGTTAFMPRNTPSSSISKVRRKSASVNWSNVLKMPTPALLTSTVTGPNFSSVCAMTSSQLADFDTSSFMNTAFSPISSAKAFPAASLMSVTTTLAPSSANLRACMAPIPCAAPVMMATLLSNLPIPHRSFGFNFCRSHHLRDYLYRLTVMLFL